jgi:hypothetical protein
MLYLLPLLVMLNGNGLTAATPDVEAKPVGLSITIDHRLYPPPIEQLYPLRPMAGGVPQQSRNAPRLRRGVIGGLIGAVAGVATCTLISNAFFNEGGSGMSTCTTEGNLTFAGGGFALGFAIGWLTGD